MAAAPWVVTTGFSVADVRVGTNAAGANQVAISFNPVPAGNATDLWNQSRNDSNFINAATTIDTLVCAVAAPVVTATAVIVCFNL